MARLHDMPEPMSSHLLNLPCPSFDTHPWVAAKPLSQRRLAVISTAGLHLRGDRPFTGITGDYRVIPVKTMSKDLVMTHVSSNFDRTGFQRDWNVVFPLDRLREMAGQGVIASVADYHYSFMGAADPAAMESSAHELARLLKGDAVDAVVLLPV